MSSHYQSEAVFFLIHLNCPWCKFCLKVEKMQLLWNAWGLPETTSVGILIFRGTPEDYLRQIFFMWTKFNIKGMQSKPIYAKIITLRLRFFLLWKASLILPFPNVCKCARNHTSMLKKTSIKIWIMSIDRVLWVEFTK